MDTQCADLFWSLHVLNRLNEKPWIVVENALSQTPFFKCSAALKTEKKTNSHWHNVCVSVWMVWIVCIAQPGTKETTQTKTKNEQKKNPKISGIVFRWITTIGLLFYDIPEYSAAQWYGWLTSGALVKQNNSQYYNVNQGISSLTQHIQLTNMAIYEEWRRNQINRPIHTKCIAFFGLLHTEQK